ncbi:coxsackievirus and adenovirus receptor homolog [Channa argus]|uniref:coxsackievirus and adenovirus receptor homolog n=1 Tax=Channa argus TaxID=215402 RepID=UPI003521FB33
MVGARLRRGLLASWTVCFCVLICFPNWSVSEVKTVHTGDAVLLLCQCHRGADIVLVKWIRPDLESEGSVFFFSDNQTYENYQHPSFCGRVELTDSQIKDGDVSVFLDNINIKDTGTYECYVGLKGNSPQLINSFHLKVKDSDHQQITVKSGDDVTLQCLDHRGGDIEKLEWMRLDPEENIFFCINGMCEQNSQVELRDPQMKDGDVSVILKNVNISNSGIYECYVTNNGSKSDVISSIHLTVTDLGGGGGGIWIGEDKDERLRLVVALSVITVILFVVVVYVVVDIMMYKKSKEKIQRRKKQNQPPPADKTADPERQV